MHEYINHKTNPKILVQIRLISYLKTMAGFRERKFEITKPTKIRDLITFDLPDDRLVILINDTRGGTPDSLVNSNDSVMISPVFGGG